MERKQAESLVARLVFATLAYDNYTGKEDDGHEEFETARADTIEALSTIPVLPALNGEPTRHYYYSPNRPLWLGIGTVIKQPFAGVTGDPRRFAVEGDPLPQDIVDSLELIHEGSTRSKEA